jgi:hypothetical protein
MTIDQPIVTCSNSRCQFVIELTDNRVLLTTAAADGGAFITCPHCGGTTLAARELVAQANVRRRNFRA